VAEELDGTPISVSALGKLDDESALVIREVLTRSDPDLLATLEASDEPAREVRERVLDVVADEFSENVHGADWEPTPWGKRVDDALGWFLHRFPIDS
jgi:hypothetical protein